MVAGRTQAEFRRLSAGGQCAWWRTLRGSEQTDRQDDCAQRCS